MDESPWVFPIGSIALIGALYRVKLFVMRRQGRRKASLMFLVAVAAAIPITWWLSPDWGNRHVFPIANFVGTPMLLLTVPVASFLLDLQEEHPAAGWKRLVRNGIEWFVAIPIWFFVWISVELSLGWVWI